MERDLAAAKATSMEWSHVAAKMGVLRGRQHVLGMIQQLCHWRAWQLSRGKRIVGLTTLQGTRLLKRREKVLAREQAELHARNQLLIELARFSCSPECTLTVRPVVKRLAVTTDTKRLMSSITRQLGGDLSAALGISPERLSVEWVPEETDDAIVDDGHMGLALLAESGACDFKVGHACPRARIHAYA